MNRELIAFTERLIALLLVIVDASKKELDKSQRTVKPPFQFEVLS